MFHVELVRLAELQIEQGNLKKAKQALTQALKYNPDYSWANLRMANLLLKENQVEYAEQYLGNTIKEDLKHDRNLRDAISILKGDIARFKGKYEQAIYDYDRVINPSTNLQILKSSLHKQLKILISVPCQDIIEKLIDKYFNIDEQIKICFIKLFYQISLKYRLTKHIKLINDKYTYLSNDLLSYRVNRLLVVGSFNQAYNLISDLDINHQDKKYHTLVLYAEINEFVGNKLLSIKCIKQALLIQNTVYLKIKKILLLAENEFPLAAEELKNLLLNCLNELKTDDFQLLLNNIKYKGSQLFEYVLKNYYLSSNESRCNSSLRNLCTEQEAILFIQQSLEDISRDKLDFNRVFYFLAHISLNSLLKREILIQIYNSTYDNCHWHFLFIDRLNKYISRNDIYYRNLVRTKVDIANIEKLKALFIVVLNSNNIGDTILYLYSLFELFNISSKQIVLITCFENKEIINLVKDNWIESIIYLTRQDITSRYCPCQEIRPVTPGNIVYLSQGGKDRLKVSTKDGIWSGNFLNFRRLNVSDYYLRIFNRSNKTSHPIQNSYYNFSRIIKNNASALSKEKTVTQDTVVIAPIANSLGYYYNLSEMNYLWVSIINCLTSAGFNVTLLKSNKESYKETDDLVQSIVKLCENQQKISELDLNVTDFVKYIENVGYFIGIRSGICDLINFVDSKQQKRLCIYPPQINYCCGLSTWISTNFLEYHLPEKYLTQLENVTFKTMSLLGLND